MRLPVLLTERESLMRPLSVVNLIILGSCFAITFSLTAVVIVILVLGGEYPRLQAEFESSLRSLALFTVMTVISALSFYGLLKTHPKRYWGQALMWSGVFLTGWYYWP